MKLEDLLLVKSLRKIFIKIMFLITSASEMLGDSEMMMHMEDRNMVVTCPMARVETHAMAPTEIVEFLLNMKVDSRTRQITENSEIQDTELNKITNTEGHKYQTNIMKEEKECLLIIDRMLVHWIDLRAISSIHVPQIAITMRPCIKLPTKLQMIIE